MLSNFSGLYILRSNCCLHNSFIMHSVDPELERCLAAAVDATQCEAKDRIAMNENTAYGKGMLLARSSESEAIAQQQTGTRDDGDHSIVRIVQSNDDNR